MKATRWAILFLFAGCEIKSSDTADTNVEDVDLGEATSSEGEQRSAAPGAASTFSDVLALLTALDAWSPTAGAGVLRPGTTSAVEACAVTTWESDTEATVDLSACGSLGLGGTVDLITEFGNNIGVIAVSHSLTLNGYTVDGTLNGSGDSDIGWCDAVSASSEDPVVVTDPDGNTYSFRVDAHMDRDDTTGELAIWGGGAMVVTEAESGDERDLSFLLGSTDAATALGEARPEDALVWDLASDSCLCPQQGLVAVDVVVVFPAAIIDPDKVVSTVNAYEEVLVPTEETEIWVGTFTTDFGDGSTCGHLGFEYLASDEDVSEVELEVTNMAVATAYCEERCLGTWDSATVDCTEIQADDPETCDGLMTRLEKRAATKPDGTVTKSVRTDLIAESVVTTLNLKVTGDHCLLGE